VANKLQGMNSIAWPNSISKGIFHRHTVEIEQLTNEGVELIDELIRVTTRIPWSEISNVVVLNSHRLFKLPRVRRLSNPITKYQ